MTASNRPTSSGDQSAHPRSKWEILQSNWANSFLYFTRLGTVVCCLCFFIAPILSNLGLEGANAWYRRALISSAATSALRLRQRVSHADSHFRFSLESLALLLSEDSLHYLLYSMLFVMVPPVTVALVPIFSFALLHSASFTESLIRVSDSSQIPRGGSGDQQNASPITRTLLSIITKIRSNEQFILRMIAINEILLMFISIMLALSGPKIIFLPFLYYHFLKMRYTSRRNPFSRTTFTELRLALQQATMHRLCPSIVSRCVNGFIGIIGRLCPAPTN